MKSKLVARLPEGPLDIVGDVHGNLAELERLLRILGYDADGNHTDGRSLVFVGDLVDRGPDSPGTARLVKRLIENGKAMMCLGNHEMNLLAGDSKPGSGWYFREREAKERPIYLDFKTVDGDEGKAIVEFFAGLPLALERDDLRIIHAAWLGDVIDKLLAIESKVEEKAASQTGDIPPRNEADGEDDEEPGDDVSLRKGMAHGIYESYQKHLYNAMAREPWFKDWLKESSCYEKLKEDEANFLPVIDSVARKDLFENNFNLVKRLMCGPEAFAPHPFFAGGRWRFTTRERWWESYDDGKPVIIGHYWRSWGEGAKGREYMFGSIPNNSWFGKNGDVFCVDYSIGYSWRPRRELANGVDDERRAAIEKMMAEGRTHRLGAMRWPERVLVFDNGDVVPTVGFGEPMKGQMAE